MKGSESITGSEVYVSSGINKEFWYLCRVNKTGNKKQICLNIAFIWMIVRISASF